MESQIQIASHQEFNVGLDQVLYIAGLVGRGQYEDGPSHCSQLVGQLLGGILGRQVSFYIMIRQCISQQ